MSDAKKWHHLSISETLDQLNVEPARGLSADEVDLRQQQFGEIFYLFNMRALRHRLSKIDFFSNKRLLESAVLMIVLQIIFTHFAFMNRIFGTAPLGIGTWMYIVVVSFTILLVVELMKWYDRYRTKER